VAQIERHRTLTGVDPDEVRALVAPRRVQLERREACVVAARTLHLDHAGAEVGEETGAVGPGEDAREIDDRDALEEVGARHNATIGNRRRDRKAGRGVPLVRGGERVVYSGGVGAHHGERVRAATSWHPPHTATVLSAAGLWLLAACLIGASGWLAAL